MWKVHRLHPRALSAKLGKPFLSFVRERQDIHLEEGSPHRLQFGVGEYHLFGLTGAVQIGQPPLHLLMEANDGGGNVIRRQLVQTSE